MRTHQNPIQKAECLRTQFLFDKFTLGFQSVGISLNPPPNAKHETILTIIVNMSSNAFVSEENINNFAGLF